MHSQFSLSLSLVYLPIIAQLIGVSCLDMYCLLLVLLLYTYFASAVVSLSDSPL